MIKKSKSHISNAVSTKRSNVSKKILKRDNSKKILTTIYPEQLKGFGTTKEVSDKDEKKAGIIIFDDMLDSNQKPIDPFSTRGQQKDYDVKFFANLMFTYQ